MHSVTKARPSNNEQR